MHALFPRFLRTLALALVAASLTTLSALAADNKTLPNDKTANAAPALPAGAPGSTGAASAKDGGRDSSNEKPPVSAKKMAQQERMKNCNAEAKTNELKGDERKAFMKNCLRAPKS